MVVPIYIASLLLNLLVIVLVWLQFLQSDGYEVVSHFNLYFSDYTEIEYIFICFDQLEFFAWVACCSFFSPPYNAVVCVCVCVHTMISLLVVVLLYTSQYVASLFTLFMESCSETLNYSVIILTNLLCFFLPCVRNHQVPKNTVSSKNLQFLYPLSFLTHLEFYFCICWEVHIFLQNWLFLTLWFFMHIEKNFKLPWKLEFNGYSIEIMDLIWKIDIVQYWVWKKQMILMQQPVQTSCLLPAHVFTHICHQTIIAFLSFL